MDEIVIASTEDLRKLLESMPDGYDVGGKVR